MGALEYVPAFDTDIPDSQIDVTEMTQLASAILTGRQSAILSSDEMSKVKLLEIGSSAGGARAKAIIAWNEATNEVKSGQINAGSGFDYWLIKFDGVAGNGDHEVADKRQHTLIEYAYSLMAKDLNIQMSECRILEKDGFHHFMTKRFDRVNGKKIHMQTLAALTHTDFNIPCLFGYEMYANYAQRLGVSQAETEQIYKRMVFAVIGMNCDDHVKNFSFLMDREGKWSLSPAYDITFAYNPDNRWISQHQMTINGKSKEITDEDLIACGQKMGLNSDYCKSIIANTRNVVSGWLEYAERCGIAEERADEINVMLRQQL